MWHLTSLWLIENRKSETCSGISGDARIASQKKAECDKMCTDLQQLTLDEMLWYKQVCTKTTNTATVTKWEWHYHWLTMLSRALTGLVTDRVITTSWRGRSLASRDTLTIWLITSIPFTTFPNTTCFPSKCGVGTNVIKNCDPFVSFPVIKIWAR